MKAFLGCAIFCLMAAPSIAEEPTALMSAIQHHLKNSSESTPPQHRYVLVDLNGDGILDAVVLLTAHDFCGSGGCTLEIFRGEGHGFTFVSGSTLSLEPMRISTGSSHGWKTLIVASQRSSGLLMRFDGRRYPPNPSMQPRASDAEIQAAMPLTLVRVP